jgi:hypothetical protein
LPTPDLSLHFLLRAAARLTDVFVVALIFTILA